MEEQEKPQKTAAEKVAEAIAIALVIVSVLAIGLLGIGLAIAAVIAPTLIVCRWILS